MRTNLNSVLGSIALAIVLAPDLAASREWHVKGTGDDQADGATDRPLKTLKAALKRARPGDEIRLAAGEYPGGFKTTCEELSIVGEAGAIVRGPHSGRAIEVLHDKIKLRGLEIADADIGVWLFNASDCALEELTIHDIGGEGVRIKNQSSRNVVRRCLFERMGREGFDVAKGQKNGEGVYIGTAPEQRGKNDPPNVPDRCLGNIIEDCTFTTAAAEAVDIKEDSEENIVRRCIGTDSRDPDGAIFGSRGDRNRFEHCTATGGQGHGFRFGGDHVAAGEHGQQEARQYGRSNVMRDCVAEKNARYGAAEMVKPQDIDASNRFADNGKGDRRGG